MPKEDTQFKKGVSGNPGGRPKGTLKDYVRDKFVKMSENQKEEFLKTINKETIWKMGEGNPESQTDITTAGQSLNPILVKFINGKDNTDTTGVQEPIR